MSGNLKEHPKVLALCVVAFLALSGGAAYTFWPTPPPVMPETMEDVKVLLENKRYQNLSPEQKRPYVQRVSELMRSSDREQRRELMQSGDQARDAMREMMMQMMADRAKQFATATPIERERMIQEDLAKFGNRGPGRGGRPGGGGGDGQRNQGERGGNGDRPEPTEEERAERRKQHEQHIEEWVNEGNGQEAAWMKEYWQALRQRRDVTR